MLSPSPATSSGATAPGGIVEPMLPIIGIVEPTLAFRRDRPFGIVGPTLPIIGSTGPKIHNRAATAAPVTPRSPQPPQRPRRPQGAPRRTAAPAVPGDDPGMPRRRSFDSADVDALLRRNHGIATHRELRALGVPVSTIARWANKGPWQWVLPGVIAGRRGPLTRHELRLAAVAYAGKDAVISGQHALDLLGIAGDRISVDDQVLVLIPWTRRRSSSGFVMIERTERAPEVVVRRGLPVVGPDRAAADAARHGADLDRVRELFSAPLHQSRCSVQELHDEVHRGPTQRSAAARLVLSEISAGVRSAAEGRARKLIAGSALPQPVWNEPLVFGDRFVGEPDAYWKEFRVALEVDGMRWHSTPADVRRTQAKQRRYAAEGVLLVTVAPTDVRDDPQGFLHELEATLLAAAARHSA
jgi:hypothetical protein